jgi:hypothetical protein
MTYEVGHAGKILDVLGIRLHDLGFLMAISKTKHPNLKYFDTLWFPSSQHFNPSTFNYFSLWVKP